MDKKVNDYLNDRELNALKNFCSLQFTLMGELGGDDTNFVSFKDESGVNIVNPFIDNCGIFEVDPVEHYGDDFLNSEFMNLFTKSIL